jgi:hypothetical protein
MTNVVHRLQAQLEGTFGALGSGSMVFEPRLRLKAQPIEPVHKISLEMPVIQSLPLFVKLLLLDTKIKFNHSLQHL